VHLIGFIPCMCCGDGSLIYISLLIINLLCDLLLSSTEILHMADNQLSGPLPNELGDLKVLSEFIIYPCVLISLQEKCMSLNFLMYIIVCHWIFTGELDLSFNNLTGTIPESFGELKNMGKKITWRESRKSLCVLRCLWLCYQLFGLYCSSFLFGAETLNLLRNRLEGVVPESLCEIFDDSQDRKLFVNDEPTSIQVTCACCDEVVPWVVWYK